MNVHLRPLTGSDYPRLIALYNRSRPEVPETEATLRTLAETFRDEELFSLVTEDGPEIIGAIWAHQSPAERQARLDVVTARATGKLARTLYDAALTRLSPSTESVVVRVRENWAAWLRFYESRGFVELERMWESRLPLTGFAAPGLGNALQRVTAAGVKVGTLAELPDTEAVQRRLYQTVAELLGDVPFSEALTIWPFEVWQRRFWQNPNRRPESFFLALAGDDVVGVSELRAGARPNWLYTGLTGVKRPYRRRGIALALKLSALRHAKDLGAEVVSTQNHVHNRPMLAINEALGFVKEPAWVRLKKRC